MKRKDIFTNLWLVWQFVTVHFVYWKRLPSPFNIFLLSRAYVRRVSKWWWHIKKDAEERGENKRMWKIAIAGKMINWQFLVASIARAHHIKIFMLLLCDTARGLLHLWVWHERWIEKKRGKKGMCAVSREMGWLKIICVWEIF